jgi:predicted DNA binding CopG/RHH family protein
MTNKKLDPQEKSIRDSYNRGEWQSIRNFSREAARYQEYAQSALRKDTRINIRISSEVLDGLKSKAMEEGLPYQTLISSVLYKYVSGRLVDRSK